MSTVEELQERCEIVSTWNKTDEDWHARRLIGIGGSEVSVLVPGANKYQSELHLFGVKTGRIPHDVLDSEPIRLGHRLERPIAEEYASVENIAIVEWPVSLQWREKPWMLANLDFLQVIPSEQFPAGVVTTWKSVVPPAGILRIVEIKTSGLSGYGTAHQWFVDGDETVPLGYELQVRHYEIVTGILDGVIVGLLGGHGLTVREVPYDEATAEGIVTIEEDFWTRHVLEDFPPEPDGSDSTDSVLKELYPRSIEGKVVDGGSTLGNLWYDFQNAKATADEADRVRKGIRAKIINLIGDADTAYDGPKAVCTYRSSKDGTSFDEDAFKKANPELYQQFVVTKPGHRTLRAAPAKLSKGVEA